MSALRLQTNSFGQKYMPLTLKKVLMTHGIKQTEWCATVQQKGGKPLGITAAVQIINWDSWPKNTPKESIKKQTETFLREQGVSEAEIAQVWIVDDKDLHRHAHPIGVHVAQTSAPKEYMNLIGETEMLSQNAKKQFTIFRNPFYQEMNSQADVFESQDTIYVRQCMQTTAQHGGILAVIGESGSGKSTIRKDFLQRIHNESDRIRVVFPRVINKKNITAGSLCEAIIMDMDPDSRIPQSLENKARMVEKLLKQSSDAGGKHVIIIEEAHDLDIHILKLLKRIYEIEDGFKKLISIILIGQTELANKLNEGKYPDAREFIRRCEQTRMSALDNHLEDYLAFKFYRVKVDVTKVLHPDVYDAIRSKLTATIQGESVSFVNPQMVGNTIIKAMNLAADIGESQVTAALIHRL